MAPSGAVKKPYWGCSKCGFATNWACKPECHKCGNGAPYKVLARLAGACSGASTDAAAAPGVQLKPKAKATAAAGLTAGSPGEAKLRQ
eukprot:15304391-Alexandrium_andersonii.AAC.1